MVKKFFIAVLISGVTLTGFSQDQQSRALAEAQRKMDSIMNDPRIKQLIKQSKQPGNTNLAAIAANPMSLMAKKKPDTAFLSGIKMPPKDADALATIPAQPMSRTQLVAYIQYAKKAIYARMPSAIGRGPLNVSAYSAAALNKGAVLAWSSGNTDLAVELAIDAADKDPDDDNVLNNLSGIVTMCGVPSGAIPILDYIRQDDPGNSTINNNLGQAYFLLGEQQKATAYLTQALAGNVDHPNANFAMACMAYINGNKDKAIDYCQHSIRGAFNTQAWTMLKSLKPDARLMDLVRHRYKQQEYFSPHKYPLLPQCREVKDVRALTVEYAEYNNMLIHMKAKYEALVKADANYVKNNLASDIMAKAQQHKNPLRPFSALAMAVIGDLGEDLADRLKRLNDYDSNYFHQMTEFQSEHDSLVKIALKPFAKRADAAGEGNPDMELEADMCKAANAVHNAFLPKFADLTEDWQRQWINQTKDFYNDYAYWCYLASTDDHSFRQMFYTLAVQGWLDLILKLNTTKLLSCNLPVTYTKKEADSIEIGEAKCPLSAKIDAGLKEKGNPKPENFASFEINCEEFNVDFDLPDGAKLSFKQRASGSTTVALGAGLSASNGEGKKKWIAKILPVSAGASMGTYLTLGGSQPVDWGMKYDAEINLPECLGGKNSAGWGFSVNNGVEFHGKGQLVELITSLADKYVFKVQPEAPQLYKNLKKFHAN